MNKTIVYERHSGIMNEDIPLSYNQAPVITKEDYEERIETLLAAAAQYTHLCIYADKEHFSNLEYLTGYDPRYEECVFLLKKGSLPRLIVGNEGMGQSQCISIEHEKILFQSLSPLGQPRGGCQSLVEILEDFGLGSQAKVGVLGWKSFTEVEFKDSRHTFEVPSFLIEELKRVAESVENANWLMMDNEKGIRVVQNAKILVLSEIASTKASRKTWEFLKGLKEGITELEASQNFNIDGEPCPTYPNVCFYGKGILSPDYHRRLKLGQPIAFGMGYRYAQIHRVGLFINSFDDLDASDRANMERLFKTYFNGVTQWFEALGLGVSGGEVWNKVEEAVGGCKEFGIVLNPGHLIHSEEWLNSPFVKEGRTLLKSGMMLQCDFTARPAYCMGLGVHMEDGVILADEAMREAIKKLAPVSYERMIRRQRFMREVLGIRLKAEVLPTSDMCGIFHPFYGDLDCILINRYER